MSDRAVLTLQLGHYANYVGAHFWNAQEAGFVYDGPSEIHPDILFREGQTLNREVTFTPRLVSVDVKGALGTLPELGGLYDPVEVLRSDGLLWEGESRVQKEEPKRKNDYLRELDARENVYQDKEKDESETHEGQKNDVNCLDDQIQTWSDFYGGRFHPKTNVVLKEFQFGNKIKPFDIHGVGMSCWKEDEAGEDIEDRIRYFVEEAEAVQGFQILYDDYDGFGGLSSSLVELLADEYGRKAVLAFPTSPSFYQEYSAIESSTRCLNTILSLDGLTSSDLSSTMVTPLSLNKETFTLPGQGRRIPGVKYRPELHYHSSAVLASTLDTMTLPWRSSRDRTARIFDISSGLTRFGRKVASVSTVFPLTFGDEHFVDVLAQGPVKGQVSLTPAAKDADSEVTCQAVSLRGLNPNDLRPADFKTGGQKYAEHPYLSHSDSASEALMYHNAMNFPRTLTGVNEVKAGLPVTRPFPTFFGEKIKSDKIVVMTSWKSSNASLAYVKSLCERGKRFKLSKLHRFKEAGLEDDEYVEVLERLSNLKSKYEPDDDMI